MNYIYGFNLNSISPSVPKINALDRATDRQSDLIRVPFFPKRYETLKTINFTTYLNQFKSSKKRFNHSCNLSIAYYE